MCVYIPFMGMGPKVIHRLDMQNGEDRDFSCLLLILNESFCLLGE